VGTLFGNLVHLLLTILVVVTPIVIMHFDICILPKYIFDGSWGTWGKRKLQEGGEPDFDSIFGGIEATALRKKGFVEKLVVRLE